MAIAPLDVDSDAALVRAAQAGDPAAFSELFRRHHAAVRRVCARRLPTVTDADEVAQASFVRAFERLDRCGGDRRFGGWVQTIAHNLCMDFHRARARTVPTEEPLDSSVMSTAGGPEDEVLRTERVQLVHEALGALPPRQRDVVIARDLHGRKPAEIAAALGLSIGAVDSLLLRGRRRLATTVENMALETGAASAAPLATVSAAAGTVSGAGPFARVVASMAELATRVTHQVAAGLGLVTGGPSPGARAASLVAAAALFAPLTGGSPEVAVSETTAPEVAAVAPAPPVPPAIEPAAATLAPAAPAAPPPAPAGSGATAPDPTTLSAPTPPADAFTAVADSPSIVETLAGLVDRTVDVVRPRFLRAR